MSSPPYNSAPRSHRRRRRHGGRAEHGRRPSPADPATGGPAATGTALVDPAPPGPDPHDPGAPAGPDRHDPHDPHGNTAPAGSGTAPPETDFPRAAPPGAPHPQAHPQAHPRPEWAPAPGHRQDPGAAALPRNPYEELADLADPFDPEDPFGTGLRPARGRTRAGTGPAPADAAGDEPWSPPNHRRIRRGRSRFSLVPRTVKALVALAACAVILVLADRCAVMYAEQQAGRQVQRQLGLATAPEVDIRGFPFLTQVLDGRLDRVDVTIPDVAADRVSLARVRASAHDIRLDGSLPDSVTGAVVGKVDGEVLLSFDDLNRELGASQVRFSPLGDDSVRAVGRLPLAGQELRLNARARIRRDGDRGVSTDVGAMRLDIPGVASYRPGRHAGLRLHPDTAERISRDAAKAKAMLSVPALARRLGVPQHAVDEALKSDRRLHDITGSPRFVERLTRVNLVDLVAGHPRLLARLGVDPKLATALTRLKPPELSERLALSFQLPKQAAGLRLRDITVQRDGIRADLAAVDLKLGPKRPA
ncbi:LmeA family phospholipid-binding protein [Streptomyces sp. NPDC018031]|uniref:DUF2993 domain-containing protein n=1 Tax=Streptomyces sp. NPDC018031 TaxID=3365033 RepID=UPI00379826AD